MIHIIDATKASIKEEKTKLKKLYILILLILPIAQLIRVTKGIIKPIITGIAHITKAIIPISVLSLLYFKFLKALTSLVNSDLPLKNFSIEIMKDIKISKIIDNFPADTISPKLNQ